MIRILLIVISLSFLHAQSDSLHISKKDGFYLDANAAHYLDSIKNELDFKYSLKEEVVEENAFLNWLRSLLSFSPTIVNILTWLAVFLFVMAIIYYFAKQDMAWIFKSKDDLLIHKKATLAQQSNSDHFEQLISEAMAREDFKAVIHYYYTHILSLLSSKKIISFSKEKTNMDYYYEINKKEIKEIFKRFSREFDYIYYGDFEVNRAIIDEITDEYRRFIVSMKS